MKIDTSKAQLSNNNNNSKLALISIGLSLFIIRISSFPFHYHIIITRWAYLFIACHSFIPFCIPVYYVPPI